MKRRDVTTGDILVVLTVAALSALCAAPPVIVALTRAQVVDRPNARSSHGTPTLRGGGGIIALGALVAVGASAATGVGEPRTLLTVGGVSAACAVVGLIDDVRGLPAMARLLLQVGAAAAASSLLLAGTPVLLVALAVLWVVGFVNAFNFMDGINGLAAIEAVVAGSAYAVLGLFRGADELAALGIAVASASLVFVPLNFPAARIFLGDVGSYFLGAWLSAAALIGVRDGVPVEAMLAPVALFIADTSWTLLRRLSRGERPAEAHREHVYQRLTRNNRHWLTTAGMTGTTIVLSMLGLVSFLGSVSARIAADVLIGAIVVAYLCLPGVTSAAGGTRLRTWRR